MRDSFFSKTRCDRCGAPLTVRIMSMFNEDVICMECKEKERQRPDYREAVEADLDAIRRARGPSRVPGDGGARGSILCEGPDVREGHRAAQCLQPDRMCQGAR